MLPRQGLIFFPLSGRRVKRTRRWGSFAPSTEDALPSHQTATWLSGTLPLTVIVKWRSCWSVNGVPAKSEMSDGTSVLMQALLKFLPPAHRGRLLQSVILVFTFMGTVAGYVAAKVSKFWNSENKNSSGNSQSF